MSLDPEIVMCWKLCGGFGGVAPFTLFSFMCCFLGGVTGVQLSVGRSLSLSVRGGFQGAVSALDLPR